MVLSQSTYIVFFVCIMQPMKCLKIRRLKNAVQTQLLPENQILLGCSKRLTSHTLVLRGESSQMEQSDELVDAYAEDF
jgi:hypothetical protein